MYYIIGKIRVPSLTGQAENNKAQLVKGRDTPERKLSKGTEVQSIPITPRKYAGAGHEQIRAGVIAAAPSGSTKDHRRRKSSSRSIAVDNKEKANASKKRTGK